MFADDTAIITQNKRFSVVISNLQHYVSMLELWLTDSFSRDEANYLLDYPRYNFWPTRPLGKCCQIPGVIFRRKTNICPSYRTDSQKSERCSFKKLVSRKSKLAIRHKVLLFNSISDRSCATDHKFGGSTGMCHLKKLHTLTSSFLRQIVNAPWFVRNEVIYRDLKVKPFLPYIKNLSKRFFDNLPSIPNELVSSEVFLPRSETGRQVAFLWDLGILFQDLFVSSRSASDRPNPSPRPLSALTGLGQSKRSQQGIRFFSWNANGLKSNLEELKDCIIDYNPDVIGIQETHLRPADRVSIPNYTCHRSDRTTHRGGGTALFVKNSIRHHTILNVSNTFENSSVILQLGNNSKITVACIYRPPHGSINTTELDAILNHSNKAFLFGDFNARHPSWNPGRANTNGNILCNWAVGSALDILAPDTPTHFNSRHSNAILDIGFAVNLSHTEVFTINTLSSDHNPVIFDFVTNNVLPPILRTLKTTNWIKFQEIIYHTIPGNPRIDDLDLAVQNFTSNISNAISASTSTRLITTPHLRLPENIRELIRAKNRFRKLWNDTRYPPYKREVNALIRQIRREIQHKKKNRTWKDFLLTLNPEDNSLYNLHRKFSKRHIPLPPLHGPGGMAYSDFEKAEAFKDTLEVPFQENEEPYCDDKIEEVESLVDDYFDNLQHARPLTSPSEVRGIIKKLQNRKAAGPDQIPNIAFKYFTQNALTHLTKLYNQCLIKNHFPTLWKQANIIMLAKPNQDRTYPQGYRPISLINANAKIFERIILTRIKSHCKAIDCIPPEQCGFREGHSTLHQLIRVTNIINEGFAHKFYTVGVFLDVRRAFDKMWHDGLTYKLIKLQFPDYLIKIIHNFLHNRTFRVRVNNSYSNTGSCLSGVPQGSVLSPYLYNIYTHDFPQHSTVSTCLFADDSAVLSQGVQLEYTIKTVQHFLDKLETWLTHWRIAINVDKSQAIVFRKWGGYRPAFPTYTF
ncbi:probable RNA-directed DNA polymerase from transposon X-element [Trichonephila clavipes]|nr:probable RNA-directed DNA polymerase from transposon X-element [Trichonephila clavipes]